MHIRFLSSVLFTFALGCGASTAKPKATTATSEEMAPISGEPTATDDGATSAADATKTYPIHLRRHGHVGDRSRVVLDSVEDDVIHFHVASRRKEIGHKHVIKHMHLEGVWTLTEVDASQDELRGTLEITKLTENDAVLLKNKRIDITKAVKKEDAILTSDGKPISSKLRMTLQELFSFRVDAARSDDALLGTSQPQSVGGHWPINGERAREDLLADAGVESTAVSGEATLVSVEHIGDADVLRIKADVQIEGMVYPIKTPGATCEPTQGRGITTTLYPLDENRGPLESHTSFVVAARVHLPGPRGSSVTGDVDMAAQHDAYVTPL